MLILELHTGDILQFSTFEENIIPIDEGTASRKFINIIINDVTQPLSDIYNILAKPKALDVVTVKDEDNSTIFTIESVKLESINRRIDTEIRQTSITLSPKLN